MQSTTDNESTLVIIAISGGVDEFVVAIFTCILLFAHTHTHSLSLSLSLWYVVEQ
jgi:hypothetical protein